MTHNKPSLNFFLISYEKKIQAWFVQVLEFAECNDACGREIVSSCSDNF